MNRMNRMNPTHRVLLLAALCGLSACATMPHPLRGNYVEIAPTQATSEGRNGVAVRWGGRIIAVTPSPHQTCFEILSRQLNERGRPVQDADQSRGRFIACRAGFYDPAIFTSERDVTVIGTLDGFEMRRIGEYDYHYPHLAADVIYLWPPQPPRARLHYVDPFWPGFHGIYYPGYYGYGGFHYPLLLRRPPLPDESKSAPQATAPER